LATWFNPGLVDNQPFSKVVKAELPTLFYKIITHYRTGLKLNTHSSYGRNEVLNRTALDSVRGLAAASADIFPTVGLQINSVVSGGVYDKAD
jgi:hypothetical protein